MFLTPNNGSGQLRFAIKNGGSEQQLNSSALVSGKWNHVAVTLAEDAARMYLNGEQVSESNAITISPIDFKPVLNYIGRSQFSDPLLNGYIDDFRVYNYALTANEIAEIPGLLSGIEDRGYISDKKLSLYPIPATNILNVKYNDEINNQKTRIAVYDTNGRLLISEYMTDANDTKLNVSGLTSGIYLLRLTNKAETLVKRFVVNH